MNQSDLIWAEDEARQTAKKYLGLCQDESIEYARNWLAKQRPRMHGILTYELPPEYRAEVCARYDATLISEGISL